MAELVTGMFLTRDAAERAVADLEALGCSQNAISVMMSDQTRAHQFAVETAIREKGGLRGGRPYASLSFARRLASSRRLV